MGWMGEEGDPWGGVDSNSVALEGRESDDTWPPSPLPLPGSWWYLPLTRGSDGVVCGVGTWAPCLAGGQRGKPAQ